MAEVMHTGTEDPESRPQGTPSAESRKIDLLERVPMLNDDPLFVEALSETVEAHAAPWLRGSLDAA